jgi:hypothetical protein
MNARAFESAGLRCARELNHQHKAVKLLWLLEQELPDDTEVLYLEVHTFCDLSTRASQKLLMAFPAFSLARKRSGTQESG